MLYIQGYWERGTYGGLTYPQQMGSTWELFITDSDGEDHVYKLYASTLESAKSEASRRCGLPPDQIEVKIV